MIVVRCHRAGMDSYDAQVAAKHLEFQKPGADKGTLNHLLVLPPLSHSGKAPVRSMWSGTPMQSKGSRCDSALKGFVASTWLIWGGLRAPAAVHEPTLATLTQILSSMVHPDTCKFALLTTLPACDVNPTSGDYWCALDGVNMSIVVMMQQDL